MYRAPICFGESFDADEITTVTFDSYSTLVDVEAAENALAERVPDPGPVSRLWRARSLEYTFVANHIDAYQPFYEMNRDTLQYALEAHGIDLPADERDDVLAVYHELDVTVVLDREPAALTGAARQQAQILTEMDIPSGQTFDTEEDLKIHAKDAHDLEM